MDKLTVLLDRLGRRLRLRDGWLFAQRSLWLAGLAAMLIQLAGRLWPVERLWLWSVLPLALWLLAVFGFSSLRRMSPLRVARRCDAELLLKERLATAVELEEWKNGRMAGSLRPSILPSFHPSLVALQQQDALAMARTIDPRRAFPLYWLRRPLLLAALLAAVAVALAALPNGMNAILAERAAVAEAAQEQAAQIEKLRQEIEEVKELTPAERQELLRQLAQLAEQLRANRGERAEALADLSKVEETLRQKLDPGASSRQAAMEALAAQLQALAPDGARGLARQQASQKADLSAIEEALQALAEQVEGMGQAEQQALSQSLGQMASRAARAGNAELAQALAALAQATQAGDAQAVAQSAQNAAGAMSKAQGDLAAQAAVQQALAQVQDSRQAMASAGQPSAQAGAQAPGAAAGQAPGAAAGAVPGQNQGQGPGQGQSQNAGQGQPGGGGGTRADTLPPARRTGKAGRPQGAGQPGGTGDLGSQVYVPWEHRPGSGEQVTLPGQDTGQGETETREQRDPLPGAPGQALVPYHQVYYDYLDAANEAVEQSYIPSGLKDYVRAYFSQLEP
jgi:hypothetical protein